jgi:hypothetical protein
MYLSKDNTISVKEIGEFQKEIGQQFSDTKSDNVSDLAAATFDAFQPYINIYDCGKKLWDEGKGKPVPKHLITHEAYKFAQIRRTLPESTRKAYKPVFEKGTRKGRSFHYWAHYLNGILSSKKIVEHIQGDETYYFTSSRRRRAVGYLDLDAHNGQEDEIEAKQLLQTICSCSLWNPSGRGQNGYVKFYYGPIRNPDLSHSSFQELSDQELTSLKERISNGLSAKQINELLNRAQKVYGRYLNYHGIACTFEIKGKVTEYTTNPLDGTLHINSGSLAKFPFTGWTWDRLQEFKNLKEIHWYIWERQLQLLEKMLDEKESSNAVEVEPVTSRNENISEPNQITAPVEVCLKVANKSNKATTDSESCAFQRSHRDCKPFVRNFYRKRGRIPTHDEFLSHVESNNLFSGEWDDPQSDRSSRTARVLDFTLQTFAPSKLGKGQGRWGNLPVLDWVRQYARDHYGSMKGEIVKDKDKLIFCDEGVKSGRRIQQCNVSAAFTHHCIWVILTCLEDLADNDGLPEDRIVEAWSLLPCAPKWNRDHYAIVRDILEKHGIIDIYDKNHRRKKCWRWRKGKNYPHSPEELKKKLKRITSCGTGLFLSVRFSLSTYKITPYCKVVGVKGKSCLLYSQKERPPPLERLQARRNRPNKASSFNFPQGSTGTLCRDLN